MGSNTIIFDTVEQQELTVNTQGYHAVRRGIVEGFSGFSGYSGYARLYAAVNDPQLAALGVGIGHAHPTMTAIFNNEIKARAITPEKVELVATYVPFAADSKPDNTQQPKLTISSYIQTSDTNEDVNGDPLVVTHTDDPDIVATVQIDTCLTNLSFERLETAPPIGKQVYVETLNDAGVTWRGFTFAAKTLRITSINGTPADDSGNYKVVYNILYKPDGWQSTVVYEIDGTVPGDITAGNGLETYDMYATSTYSTLNLS